MGGHALAGRELADALDGLVDALNREAPPSLQRALHASLSLQAGEAVAAGVQAGIDTLRQSLLPPLARSLIKSRACWAPSRARRA